jgi:phospholipase/carboxylesterase
VTAQDFGAPVVAWHGADDPATPLVVLLHGRGSDESGIIGLADHLPKGAGYAAVRAPIAEGGGYAWFANRGIGRPVAESISATIRWFRTWLDEVAPNPRPVAVVGFSGGAAFAGGLILDQPDRFAAAAILYGTLPFDAGLPTTPGRLAGLPVFVAQGSEDSVIPRELLERTWTYLNGPAGTPSWANRYPGGHQLTLDGVRELAGWIEERFTYLDRHGAGPVGAPEGVHWPGIAGGTLPARSGGYPDISTTTPQQQLTDNAPGELQEQLFRRLSELDGVSSQPSAISVPGARAFIVIPAPQAPEDAFLVKAAGEFAHLHPAYDGSMHLALPTLLAHDAIAKG